MNTPHAVTERIHQWVLAHFPAAAEQNIAVDDSLLDSGIVDSMGTLEIVEYLDDSFDVEVSDEDMVADHFESVRSIAAYTISKLGLQSNPSPAADDDARVQ